MTFAGNVIFFDGQTFLGTQDDSAYMNKKRSNRINLDINI
jgi:hypothetical protein